MMIVFYMNHKFSFNSSIEELKRHHKIYQYDSNQKKTQKGLPCGLSPLRPSFFSWMLDESGSVLEFYPKKQAIVYDGTEEDFKENEVIKNILKKEYVFYYRKRNRFEHVFTPWS